jgi:hypothetical protein
MRVTLFSLCAAAAVLGCGGGGEAGDPDAGGLPPDADLSMCLLASERTVDCTVAIGGRVVDWQTGERLEIPDTPTPIPVTVRTNTLFDGPVAFAPGCPALDTFPAVATSGEFSDGASPCDSPLESPTLLLMFDDATNSNRVPAFATAADLTCAGGTCDPIDLLVPVPVIEYTGPWRLFLAEEGMPNGNFRGLALVQYKESDGTASVGVTPTVVEEGVERNLVPGIEVFFFAADRREILPGTAATTTTSGVAIIAVDGEEAEIGGTRNAEVWPTTRVGFSDGFLFYRETALQ